MKIIDTLLYPRWLIPIEPHNVYLENHALAIHEGRILEILPQEQAQQRYQAKTTLQLKDHAVLPGLVNAHTHSPMTLFRGMADDLALMDWLENHIWPAERQWMSEEFCFDGTQLAILEMLRSGTTCFNENYFYTQSIAEATDAAGMRALIGACIIDFSSNYAQAPEQYIEKAEELYRSWKNHPLISTCIAPQAPYTVSDDIFRKIKAVADKYSMIIHLHLHETDAEIQKSLQQYQKRPIQRIYDLGLMSEKLQCIHMTQINADDLRILKKVKPQIIHCPESNLKLASGFCPVKELMDAGLNIALGTDGAASNNDLDMFGEMHTAAILAKAVAKNPTALKAAEALRMATLNGAKALGLAHEIGSLEPNKAADIIAINLTAINSEPIYDPISHLAYCVNSRQVTDVWVAGKQLLKNGEFTHLDEEKILAKARAWRQRIQAKDACSVGA